MLVFPFKIKLIILYQTSSTFQPSSSQQPFQHHVALSSYEQIAFAVSVEEELDH